MPDRPDLLTVPEYARRTSLSVSTVWRRLANGELKSVKDGRARRIPASEIDALIASAR
ncbi:MAG TPA: helix-turn-helix domain-containing protein [Mycobacteriales bacterium]|nr:helix-turn-helix domain-containing protein [Mycobacteriales bacterium]